MNPSPLRSHGAANVSATSGGPCSGSHSAQGETPEVRFLNDVGQYLQTYARERPEVAALWCFGIGFMLGWRLKPW